MDNLKLLNLFVSLNVTYSHYSFLSPQHTSRFFDGGV